MQRCDHLYAFHKWTFDKSDPEDVEKESDFTANFNPHSLVALTDCRVESSLAYGEPGSRHQFERLGYSSIDAVDSTPEALVFNRTVTLRDSWAKVQKRG